MTYIRRIRRGNNQNYDILETLENYAGLFNNRRKRGIECST